MINYKSELINKILEQRGHEKSSLHYESECIETWINEAKGGYPKLTDYESEWLNYIVENPIGEFPYETIIDVADATVDNVVPYAYKSAILKGNTLVNISSLNGEITLTPDSTQFSDSVLKESTIYTISFNCSSVPSTGTIEVRQVVGTAAVKIENKSVVQGYNKFIITASNSGAERIRFKNDSTSTSDFVFNNLMIIEGDYTNKDIRYFEGMKSVQMPVLTTTGKNLFDLETWASKIDISPGNKRYEFSVDGDVISGIIKAGCYFTEMGVKNGEPLLKPNTTYTMSHKSSNCSTTILLYKKDSNSNVSFIKELTISEDKPFTVFTTPTDVSVITFRFGRRSTNTGEFTFRTEGIQLEENSTSTSYEPFKSNILTVNEDVTLRSNGNVYDELDLLTGKLTQRIDENNEVLDQEVVKTVELSITDESGNKINHFIPIEGTMHIQTDGEPVKPSVTMEIPVEAITQNLTSFIEMEV